MGDPNRIQNKANLGPNEILQIQTLDPIEIQYLQFRSKPYPIQIRF